MSLGRSAWKETRERLQELLSKDCPTLKDNDQLRKQYVIEISDAFCVVLLIFNNLINNL